MAGKAVLGLGGAVDYEITWERGVVEDLVRSHGLRAADLTMPGVVDGERALLVALLTLLRDGRGGERFVTSSGVVEAFASRFATRATLGGTNVRAALAMHRLGLGSVVHLVSEDETVRRLLPPDVGRLCSGKAGARHPHLIVQYDAGTRVRLLDAELVAPRPNRVIYAHDPPNRLLRLHPELGTALASADVFLVSGLNSVQDERVVAVRLAELRDHASRMPAGALVLYEDAGFHAPALRAVVNEGLRGVVDVHSMNEDELQAYVGRRVDLLDPGEVLSALADVADHVSARTIVVHTAHWAIALGERAPDLEGALRGGVAMAGARYVAGEALDAAAYRSVRTGPVQAAGERVVRAVTQGLRVPAVDVPAAELMAASPTTIGLGDAFVGGMIAELVRPSG